MKNINVVNKILFKDFFQSVAPRLARDESWSDRHLKDTLSKAEVFSKFLHNGKLVGEHYVHEITAILIEDFADFMSREGNFRLNKGCSNGTINRYLSMISVLLKKAVKLRYSETYPAFSWKSEGNGRPRYFSKKEQREIFEFFRTDETYAKYTWLADFFLLGLRTGMRLGEIQKLDIGDAKIIKDDEGDELIYISKGKNGDERFIPIDGDVAEAAHRIYNANTFNHHVLYRATWKAKKIIAPNDPHFTFHVTRHTCASELANEDNQNLKLIAEYLGHRSLNTTTKYVHASHGAKKKLLQKRMRSAA